MMKISVLVKYMMTVLYTKNILNTVTVNKSGGNYILVIIIIINYAFTYV